MARKIKVLGNVPDKETLFAGVAAQVMAADYEYSHKFEESFRPTPKQQEVYDLIDNSQAPEGHWLHILLTGDTGGAKTWTALGYAIKMMTKHPGCRVLCVRETKGDIMLTTFGDVMKFFNQWDIEIESQDKTLGYIRIMNGSEIHFRSDRSLIKNQTKDKADSLGSSEFSVVIFEEADSISRETYLTISGRMRDKAGVKRKVVFAVTNPPTPRHWLYKLFNRADQADLPVLKRRWHVIQMLAKDNPYIAKGYNEAKLDDWKYEEAFLKRMGHGEAGPDTRGRPYFKSSFSVNWHVSHKDLRSTWNPRYPLHRGWDFGYNAPALVVLQDDKSRGQIRVLHSIVGEYQSTWDFMDMYLPELEELYPGARWKDSCDPAGSVRQSSSGLSDIEVMQSRGIYPTYKYTAGVSYGLNIIDEQLRQAAYQGEPAMLIDSRCQDLIDAIHTGYCVKENNTTGEIIINKDGVYDHIMDAFRYVMQDIRSPGDRYSPWEASREGWDTLMTAEEARAMMAGDPSGVSLYQRRTLENKPRARNYARGAQRRRY